MSYKLDPLKFEKQPEAAAAEAVTLDSLLDAMSQMHMKHNVVMGVASAISSMTPQSDLTVMDAILGVVGAEATEDGVTYDDDAMQYAIGVTMDFAASLGMSQSAMFDLFDADDQVAMDEAHTLASAINSAIHEEGDLAQLVTAYVHMDSIVADFAADEKEAEDATLDSITMDWSFSKKKSKRKAKTGTGHTMKTVECHRTIDGVRKKGFCRYPSSLLHGKYKKASGVSAKQKTHLAEMVTDAHTAIAKQRRSESMRLTREAHRGSAATSAKAKM